MELETSISLTFGYRLLNPALARQSRLLDEHPGSSTTQLLLSPRSALAASDYFYGHCHLKGVLDNQSNNHHVAFNAGEVYPFKLKHAALYVDIFAILFFIRFFNGDPKFSLFSLSSTLFLSCFSDSHHFYIWNASQSLYFNPRLICFHVLSQPLPLPLPLPLLTSLYLHVLAVVICTTQHITLYRIQPFQPLPPFVSPTTTLPYKLNFFLSRT